MQGDVRMKALRYFLRNPLLDKIAREDAIQKLHSEGASIADLSKRFDLSERHIREVVGRK